MHGSPATDPPFVPSSLSRMGIFGSKGSGWTIEDARCSTCSLPGGRYLGAAAVPFRLQLYPSPILRDGSLYGVVQDELDVQYVVRARVLSPTGNR